MKTYLGDSVYIEYKNYMFTLTTENGYGPSNTIHLELEVAMAFIEQIKSQILQNQKEDETKTPPEEAQNP